MLDLAEGLEILARELARKARQHHAAKRIAPQRGSTLRPGDETPLWNALVTMVKPHLDRRGAKAVLARELGLNQARMGEFFDRQSAMPDAERALQLLLWAASRPPPPPKAKPKPQTS